MAFKLALFELFILGSTGSASVINVPEIELDYVNLLGRSNTADHSSEYLGIPFAQAGRFEHSHLYREKISGIYDAAHYGPSCPQQSLGAVLAQNGTGDLGLGIEVGTLIDTLYSVPAPRGEDCLFLNIQVPENTSADAKLPVVFWIHGGGFALGSPVAGVGETDIIKTVAPNYNPGGLVKTLVEIDQPLIVVSANYRLNAFGFSASREMADAGLLNLGLEDQRVALQWTQKYISSFGGDPEKVTVLGNSAGSWSIAAHLLWEDEKSENNTDLFRAAIMASGGPQMLAGPERQQAVFDRMVNRTGCMDAGDKIECLKTADYNDIMASVNSEGSLVGIQSLASVWNIRPDGKHLKESPHRLAAKGAFKHRVPLIIGDMRDEGTFFSLGNQLEAGFTDEGFKDYFQSVWWPDASDRDLQNLMRLYPVDPAVGSPYGTGALNAITPQYKRVASVVGDYSFEAQRRNFLDHYSSGSMPEDPPVYNYIVDAQFPLLQSFLPGLPFDAAALPILGSLHAFDMYFYMFAGFPRALSANTRNIQSTTITFAHNLDPNSYGKDGITYWPPWTKEGLETYRFQESGTSIVKDDYRTEQIAFLNSRADSFLI